MAHIKQRYEEGSNIPITIIGQEHRESTVMTRYLADRSSEKASRGRGRGGGRWKWSVGVCNV